MEQWNRIAKWYGEAQIDVAVEEMAELTQALIKHKRGKPSNITEELADVEIMLYQLRVILELDEREIEAFKAQKLERTLRRLEGNDV